MSVVTRKTMMCDGCPTILDHEDDIGPTNSLYDLREYAREQRGWVRRTRSLHQKKLHGDFCPKCASSLPPTPSMARRLHASIATTKGDRP